MPVTLDPISSSDGITLTTARDWVRTWARNAGSSAEYSDSDIDRAILSVGSRFCRQTKAITKNLSATTGTGQSGDVVTFADSGQVLMPEQLLSIEGDWTSDDSEVRVMQAVDLRALVLRATDADGNVKTGKPRYAAIDNSSQAIGAGAGFALLLYPYADAAYVLTATIWANFTVWTPGTDSPDSVALNIPAPWLYEMLGTGVPAYLQHAQPEMRYASESWAKYLEFEASHKGGGLLGLRVLDRCKRR